MKLKLSKHLLFLTAVFALLVGILLFPIHLVVTTIEKNPDSKEVFLLYQDHALQQIVTPEDSNFSAITFWTNGIPTLPSNEPFTVTVTSYPENKQIRQTKTTWQQAFSRNSRTVQFSFPAIPHDANAQYTITLAAPSLSKSEALPIRKPLLTNDAAAVELSATKPLLTSLSRQLSTKDLTGEDIYYYWHRGRQILSGSNPYTCALDDTCLNHKNPGHFPLFYWLSAATEKLGAKEFQPWIAIWQRVFIAAEISIGFLLFFVLYTRKQHLLALFALLFWLFNRWSLYVISVSQIDFLPILFLVLSIILLNKKQWISLALFSVSLALKQVAVFLLPLYAIIIWREARAKRIRTAIIGLLIMVSVPIISSLPFLLDHPQGLFTGLFFSVTRTSESDLGAPSFSRLAHLQGSTSIAMMLLIMSLVYLMAFREKRVTLSIGGLAVYATFLSFNTIVFNQYFVWFMVLVPLAISELLLQQKKKRSNE